LVAGLLVSLVILFNPFIGILILVFLDPLSNLINLPGFGNLGKILGFYIIFAWLLNSLVYKKNIKTNRVFWLALAFLLWGALSIFWAVNPIISLGFIYRLIRYIGIYLLMINFLDFEERFDWVIFAFISGCFIMNIVGINLFIKESSVIVGNRMAIGGQNPNDFGITTGIAMFCLWYFFNSKSIKIHYQIIIFLIEIFFLFGFIFSQSRGAWIAFIICISGYFIFTKRRINFKNISVIIFLILTLILTYNGILHFFPKTIENISYRAYTMLFSPEEALGGRADYWLDGLERWSKNPMFGLGLFNFSTVHSIDAHSVYIAILCELGLVGFTIWIFLIFSLFKIAKSNKYYSLTIIILLFLFIVSFKGTYYASPFYWYMFAIISATSKTEVLIKNIK
jgi:O-antigen ligase